MLRPAMRIHAMRHFPLPQLTLALCLGLAGCARDTPETLTAEEPQLLRAAEQGYLAQLDRLLAGKPLVDTRDSCAWTPLMKAALNGHAEVAARLLRAGADTELGDKGGYTALMLAASNNHLPVVELLLEHGADPNRREQTRGWTALIWAAKRGHLASVQALLRAGADTRFLDQAHRSALDWARHEHHHKIAAYLQAHASG